MERDAILGHGTADFLRESLMKRADGYQTVICNGCGTIPIYNERESLYICPMCDGPVKYIGDSVNNLEILPPTKRSVASFSRIEIPYAFKMLDQELNAYLNMGLRVLTDKDVKKFRPPPISELTAEQETTLLDAALPTRILPETVIPDYLPPVEEPEVRPEDLAALGAAPEPAEPPPEPVVEPVPVPKATNSNQGVVLQLGNMNIGMPSALDTGEVEDLDAALPQPPPQAQQGVNVQMSSQPMLIVPLSMNQAPAATEVVSPAAPGAPNTIAVDTSPNAMSNIGASTPRSNTPNRNKRANSPGTAPTVNVSKVGASQASAPPAANVRVNVSKLG
jgi:hypothetical protein